MRDDWRRYAAPAAFLLAVTVAVVLIRAGMDSGGDAPATTTVAQTATHKTVDVGTTTTTKKKQSAAKRYWTVQAGDTFGSISSKSGVPVATIEQLNPTVKSTSLFIGEKLRLR